MKVKKLKCPGCGEKITMEGDVHGDIATTTLRCPHCGFDITVEQSISMAEQALAFFESQPKAKVTVLLKNLGELKVLRELIPALSALPINELVSRAKQSAMRLELEPDYKLIIETQNKMLKAAGFDTIIENI